ncbi:hypothetical protein VPH35_027045 [Triticum aestivum]
MHEVAQLDHGTLRGDDNILPRSGRGKKRSKAWDDFEDIRDDNGKTVQAECRHCKKRVQYKGAQGTRVLITHVNSAECKNTREARPQTPSHSTCINDATENATLANSSSRPTNQERTQITAAVAHPWNKDEISSRILRITHQLQGIRGNVTKDLNMFGSHSGASSVLHQRTASDPCRRTSSLLQGKVYGRDKEKNTIIKVITAGKSDSVTVVPIVGIGGAGKTALAQSVCNDPKVQNQFDHSIWVWVSNSFDEMRITREMLDIVPREKHEGLCSLDKLQQVLKTHIESKRVLLILDDVWDGMNDGKLDLILAPFKSDNANGNVILVTTRYLSVAKRIGTTEPIVLGALGEDDFWSLLKARAFRDENCEGYGKLESIGWKIAGKLKGNPLAAVTAGGLLRVDLTVDHWNKVLEEEGWKLLELGGGIMSSLKLSYDQLPYHLHQCFSYCSIFPENHDFLDEELVRIWISQGFINPSHSSKRLEEIGMDYLADLVNVGYFQQVGRNSYVVCGHMHDFARMVSRTDCAIIDGLECNDILPTVQHLSIVFNGLQHRNIHVENMRDTIASIVTKLRSFILIGQYESSFFQSFQNIFRKAHNLRLLQMSATPDDFRSVCSLVNPTHLRYLKVNVGCSERDVLQVLSKFCHLQTLDVGSNTTLNGPHGINYLVSLQYLAAASIARVGKLTSLQKLNNFSLEDCNGFQITELKSMNNLVQLGISQLENVKTLEEVCGAGLQDKCHLEKLHLSWSSDRDLFWKSFLHSEPSTSIQTEQCLRTEVLEGLQPHNNLKHLQIFGYNGASSPSWLASNIPITSLQTLHLENCGELQILPSVERLPFLIKLSLSNMPKVKEVSIPSLEELVLIKMPKLERCSCISLRDLNSCLRVLMIKKCPALKVFDLFGNSHKFKIEQKPWLPRLRELIIHKCPLLPVPHPLPSSSTVSRISMSGVSKFPGIDLRSCGSLTIGKDPEVDDSDSDSEYDSDEEGSFYRFSDNLSVLDGNILAFHNPRFLTQLIIGRCRNLTHISFKGLSQLVSLKTLRIVDCPGLFGFDVPPDHTHEDLFQADSHEDLTAVNWNALPSLECLEIFSCGITWQWLSLILQHALGLMILDLRRCPNLESLQLNSCTALEQLGVYDCESLGILEVLQCRSLRDMKVVHVPKLKSLQLHFCTALEELVIREAAVCVLEGSQSLRKLELRDNQYLESLDLYFCTALEELDILRCSSLCTLEGFQSLGSLRRLYLRDCPGLHSYLEGLPAQDCELCPQLEFLGISDFSFLATSFCRQLRSLQRLVICGSVEETTAERLTDEQETELLLLGSLTELRFEDCMYLKYLPAGVHRLGSLQVLEISFCPSISGLPGLPPSLEELRIFRGSEELKLQSKSLASSKLKVKIDNQYVN